MIDSHGTGDAYSRLFVVEETYDNLEAAKWDMQQGVKLNYAQVRRGNVQGQDYRYSLRPLP